MADTLWSDQESTRASAAKMLTSSWEPLTIAWYTASTESCLPTSLGCVGCPQCSPEQSTYSRTFSLAQSPSSQVNASATPRVFLRGGFDVPAEEEDTAAQDETSSALEDSSDSSRPKSAQRNDSMLFSLQDLDTDQSSSEWQSTRPKDLDDLIERLTPIHPSSRTDTIIGDQLQPGVVSPVAGAAQSSSQPTSPESDLWSEGTSEYSFASVSSLSLGNPFLARTPTDIMFGTDHRVSTDDDETDYDSVDGLQYSLSEMLGSDGAAQARIDRYTGVNDEMRRDIDGHVAAVDACFDSLREFLWDKTIAPGLERSDTTQSCPETHTLFAERAAEPDRFEWRRRRETWPSGVYESNWKRVEIEEED